MSGCVAVARGCVGLDIEVGTQPRIAQWVLREAALKATGEGLRGWRASDAPQSRADGTVWRGRHWHVRRLELFPGAAAAVVASEPVQALETQAVALEELFDAMSADDDGGLRNTLYRTITRSSRRMTPARRLLYALAVPLALGIIRAWWASCRVVRVVGGEHLDAALARAASLVPCYWHQHQLYCGKYLVEQRARGLTVGWLISPSVDGELGAMLVRRFGAAVIRGSSTHTGARALRDYYQALVKDNISPVITPDGPRGPRFRFKPGALLLAQMSGRPVAADGLCGLARLAHQMGQVRHPDAVRAHRDRDRPAGLRAARHRCAPGSRACSGRWSRSSSACTGSRAPP